MAEPSSAAVGDAPAAGELFAAQRQHEQRAVSDVVGRIMKRAGAEDRLTHDQVSADWKATVGEFLFKHSRPVSLRRGVLTVAVLQASVRYDLERNHKRDILARLKERYGAQKVRDVKFQNG